MRPWFKYSVAASAAEAPLDATYEEHVATAGGYDADDSYSSTAAFYARHFQDFQYGRLAEYEPFLLTHLSPGMEILSVASGRCASELRLIDRGLSVTCSDLDVPACADATRRLFPRWRFEVLDILAGPSPRQYDAVICLSLIYLFDESAFRTFLANAAASLRSGGVLLLDSAGSPDNFLSYLIHDVVLPFESRVAARKEKAAVARKLHGYRRTDADILGPAEAAGFHLVDKKTAAPRTEFRRSVAFNRFIPAGTRREALFDRLGRSVPYVRMFCLRKG